MFRPFFWALFFFLPYSVFSYELHLLNGDQLQGEHLEILGDKVTFHSKELGKLSFSKKHLKSLNTQQRVYLSLKEGLRARGLLQYNQEKQQLFIIGDYPPIPLLNLDNLVYLHPKQFEESLHIHSTTRVGGNVAKKYGNSKNFDLQTKIDSQIDFFHLGKLTHKIEARGQYSFHQDPQKTDSEGRSFDREGLFELMAKKRYGEKVFVFLGEELHFNTSKGVAFGSLAKLGFSYPFIETPLSDLQTGAGLSRRDTVYESASHKGQFDLLISLEAKHRIQDWSSFTAKFNALPNTKKFSDYNLNGRLSLSLDLAKPYILELGIIWDYDSTPDAGKKKSDLATSINFLYEF